MFEFEGDAFQSSEVVVIERVDYEVCIYLRGREDSFDYDYNTIEEAESACARAIKSWKDSFITS